MGIHEVTAVVTTRNRLEMLRRALGSILAQRDVDVPIVVVDEGSTDGTHEFLAGVAHPRITVVRNDPPLGPSGARNLGVAQAGTRWVAMCDDDDVWAPTKMRAQLDALAARPEARWAVAGTVLVDDDDEIIGHRDLDTGDDTLARMLNGNVVPGMSGLVFEKALFDELGGFDEHLWASEDWDLEIRMAAAAPLAAANGPYVAYRIAAGSLSNDAAHMRRGFELLRTRYAELAEQHGGGFDEVGYEEYLAHQELKARNRLASARSYAKLAWWRRDPRDAVRAAASFVSPEWTDRVGDRRAAQRLPAGWREEFERWIAEVPLLSAIDGSPTPA